VGGALASTMMFVVGLVGTTIVAISVLSYTAYCIVVVVSDTSAGIDRIVWPSDLMVDWIGQSLRLIGTVAVLMIPVGFLLRALGASLYPDEPGLRFLAITLPWLWLAFPVGLLSSMSVGSLYAVVRPKIVWDLLRIFPATLFFYVVSALGAWGACSLWIVVMRRGDPWLFPLAALAWAVFVLVYSRLLGRVAWLTGRLKKAPRKKAVAAKSKPRPRKKAERVAVTDPWAVPKALEEKPKPKAKAEKKDPRPRLPVESYGLSDEPPCRPPEFRLVKGTPFLDVKDVPEAPPPAETPPAPRPRFFDDEDDGVDLQMAPDDSPPSADTRKRLDVEPSRIEMRLAREEELPPPTFPMFSGVYTFPWYTTSLRAVFVLTISWTLLGACVWRLVGMVPPGVVSP
jgi:hypothetical protein